MKFSPVRSLAPSAGGGFMWLCFEQDCFTGRFKDMLMLSRKKNEKVIVNVPVEITERKGDRQRPHVEITGGMEVEVCIVEIRGDKVRWVSPCPSIAIHREEVLQRMKAQLQASECQEETAARA